MTQGTTTALDRQPEERQAGLASWYVPGLTDGLGDRLLMFDNSSAPALELLRFRADLAAHAGFERALRARVRDLQDFQHPSFASVRAVETLGSGEGLALVSNYVEGKRLSEVLQAARGPVMAAALIERLTPAIARLHQHRPGFAHGTIGLDRIVVAPGGRLVFVEHALAAALEELRLQARGFAQLGIVVPPEPGGLNPLLDARTDLFQLAVVAVSLLVGRRLSVDLDAEAVGTLLDEFDVRHPSAVSRPVRRWLDRALQLAPAFESGRQAEEALVEFPRDARSPTVSVFPARDLGAVAEPDSVGSATHAEACAPAGTSHVGATDSHDALAASPTVRTEDRVNRPGTVPLEPPRASPQPKRALPGETARIATFPQTLPGHGTRRSADQPSQAAVARGRDSQAATQTVQKNKRKAGRADNPTPARSRQSPMLAGWATAALAGFAIGEAVVIGALLYARATPALPEVVIETAAPGATVQVDGQPAGITPLKVKLETGAHSIRVDTTSGRTIERPRTGKSKITDQKIK